MHGIHTGCSHLLQTSNMSQNFQVNSSLMQLLSTCSNSLLSVLGLSTLHVSIIVEYDSLTLMADEEELQTQAYYKINQRNMQKLKIIIISYLRNPSVLFGHFDKWMWTSFLIGWRHDNRVSGCDWLYECKTSHAPSLFVCVIWTMEVKNEIWCVR